MDKLGIKHVDATANDRNVKIHYDDTILDVDKILEALAAAGEPAKRKQG